MTAGSCQHCKLKPYIECFQNHLKFWIPRHDDIYCSLELKFDPSHFVRDPSEIVACASGQCFDRWVGNIATGEVELDSR